MIISSINLSRELNISFHIRVLGGGGSSMSIPGGKFIVIKKYILIKILNHKHN